MLRFEIVKCKKPFNDAFQEGGMYKVHVNKKGQHQVFVDDEKYLILPEREIPPTERHFYLDFFEPIGQLFLRNVRECNELRNNSIEEILEIMKNQAQINNLKSN